MTDWSPRSMPTMRRQLVEALEDLASSAIPGFEPERMLGAAGAAAQAELWWITADMTRVAMDAHTDLPAWTPAAVCPAPAGMALYALDLPELYLAAGTEDPVRAPVAGALWSWRAGALNIWILTRSEYLPDIIDMDAPVAISGQIQTIPAAEAITEPIGVGGPLVALLGATWILAQTPTVVESRHVTGQGSSAARWRREDRTVTLVDLRPMRHVEQDTDPEHPGRVYQHRWIVRGHWRQQAVGPGRAQRRTTWVASHTKGPAGAPLLATEHVMVWRR